MSAIMSQTSGGVTRRCDATCHRAKKPACACICGGKYHGKGDEGAVEQLTKDWLGDDWRERKAAVEAEGGSFTAVVEQAFSRAVAAVGAHQLELPERRVEGVWL